MVVAVDVEDRDEDCSAGGNAKMFDQHQDLEPEDDETRDFSDVPDQCSAAASNGTRPAIRASVQ